MELKELQELLETYKGNMKELLTKQAEELKKHGETTALTAKSIEAMDATIKSISEGMEAAKKRMDELEAKAGRIPEPEPGKETKSIGQLFVESEQYKTFVANPSKKNSDSLVIDKFRTKTLLTSATLGNVPGYLYRPDRPSGIVEQPRRQRRVRDLFNVIPTVTGAFEFVRETSFTNAAAATAEGLAAPESALAFEIQSGTVKRIPHWIPATRIMIEDTVGIQAYINSKLLYGLDLAEDAAILYGNGVSPNVHGICTDDDIQTYSWSDGTVGDTKLDAIRRAITKARIAEYPIDGLVLHPDDWEDIELLKGSDGHYIWVNVPVGGDYRIWRVNVVETTAIVSGTFLTGAFGMAATLHDREQASISISDSHSDYFTKGIYAILAEERIEVSVERPQGFVLGAFDAAPSSGS